MAFALAVYHIDVGQGESTLILVHKDGAIARAVLVDGGKQNAGDTVVSFVQSIVQPTVQPTVQPILGEAKKHLDAVIATHYDNDHIGGLSAVLKSGLVDKDATVLYERMKPSQRPETKDTLSYKPAAAILGEKNVQIHLGQEILGLDGEDAPKLECVAVNGAAFASAEAEAAENDDLFVKACEKLKITDPKSVSPEDQVKIGKYVREARQILRHNLPKDESKMEEDGKENFLRVLDFSRVRAKVDENERSIALVLSWKNFVYYTGGDLGLEIEDTVGDYLASKFSHVCAFKASHHGSDHGTSAIFVNAIRPRVAFISCGKDNTFGESHHPAQGAIYTLELGKRTGDLSPVPDHTIQKYYLTNCGYHRYFVNMAPGEDPEWKFDPKAHELLDLQPDVHEDFNPTLYDPFKAVDTKTEEVKTLVSSCMDALSRAPSEKERANILALVDELKSGTKRRKGEFLNLLKEAASDNPHDEGEDPPEGKFWYDICADLCSLIVEQVDVDATTNLGIDRIQNVNWEEKKAVVAGSEQTPGHILLRVDETGADKHVFKVVYMGLEQEQDDAEGAQYVTIEHACITSGPHVVARKEKQVVTIDEGSVKEPLAKNGIFKRMRDTGADLPFLMRDKKATSGDCIYEAVNKRLVTLGESAIDVQTFRNQVADTFKHNPDLYKHFLTDKDVPDLVEQDFRLMGSWDSAAGDFTVTIMANLLQRKITVQTDGQPDKIITPLVPEKKTAITIQYNGKNHYW